MKRILFSLAVAAQAWAGAARLCPSTQLSAERIVLSTTSGDIVIGLYPQAAPRHAAQILRLARAGVYDGTSFLRVVPGFAVQLGGVARRGPLTGEQVKLISRIPAELNACPHRRGTVSMAHDPDDVNSAQTSFLLMAGEIPQMNGRFTVVGEIVEGEDALERLEHVAFNPTDNQPLGKVELRTARVLDAAQVPRAQASTPGEVEDLPPGFLGVALVAILAGLFLLAVGWRHHTRRALGMLGVLGGAFCLFVLFAPLAQTITGLPLVLFGGCLALFKLLSSFETG